VGQRAKEISRRRGQGGSKWDRGKKQKLDRGKIDIKEERPRRQQGKSIDIKEERPRRQQGKSQRGPVSAGFAGQRPVL